ncbi:MAG: hypothetical protein ACLR8P_14230 [Clostridium fessum]
MGQETVDLAKFVVAGFHNFAFCRHDTEIYQKWDWDAFLKDVFLVRLWDNEAQTF